MMTDASVARAKAADIRADGECYLLVAGESEQCSESLIPGGLQQMVERNALFLLLLPCAHAP